MAVKQQVILSLVPHGPVGDHRYRVFFTDGTSAITKSDVEIAVPDCVTPNTVKVSYNRGLIVKVEKVKDSAPA